MSKTSSRHTLEDLRALSEGGPDEAIREALSQRKGGLNPVHVAVLMSAIQSGRLLELLDTEKPEGEEPTAIQRIQALLETIVGHLESIDRRMSSLESRSALPPAR